MGFKTPFTIRFRKTPFQNILRGSRRFERTLRRNIYFWVGYSAYLRHMNGHLFTLGNSRYSSRYIFVTVTLPKRLRICHLILDSQWFQFCGCIIIKSPRQCLVALRGDVPVVLPLYEKHWMCVHAQLHFLWETCDHRGVTIIRGQLECEESMDEYERNRIGQNYRILNQWDRASIIFHFNGPETSLSNVTRTGLSCRHPL